MSKDCDIYKGDCVKCPKRHLTCVTCTYLCYDSGELGWSEITPGWCWTMNCTLKKFKEINGDSFDGNLMEVLSQACKCIFYEYRL